MEKMEVRRRKYLSKEIKHFDGVRAFYINAMLRALVLTLVGIFTPVYVYKILLAEWGSSRQAVLGLIMFYGVIRGTVAMTAMPISKLIEKLGFRRSVMLSVVFLVGYFGLLLEAERYWYLMYGAGGLLGMGISLYWVSRYSVLSIDGQGKKVGKEIGFLSALEMVGSILGPMGGAFVIDNWGFRVLYLLSGLILIVSVVPLLAMGHHVHRNGVSWRGFWQWMKDRAFAHQAVAFVGRAMDDYSSSIVWPLVIWLMGINLKTMGWVFSVLALLGVVYKYLSGVWFDKLYKKGGWEDERLFLVATVGQAISWLGRMMVRGVGGILMIDGILGGVGMAYKSISDDYMVLGGKRMHEIAYYTYWEIMYSLGVMVYLGVWGVSVWWGWSWKVVLFGLTCVGVLMSGIQMRESGIGGEKKTAA